LSTRRSLEEGLQASERIVEEEGAYYEVDVAMSDVNTKVLMASCIKDNTSQGKDWIFDYSSTIDIYSHKEMFNSLVAKEKGTVKIVDGLVCEVIGTRTVNVTCRDGTGVLWRQSGMSWRYGTI